MKIDNPRQSLLTNFEVMQFLDAQRRTNIKNHRTISVEVAAYLRDRPTGNPEMPQSEEIIDQFMRAIKDNGIHLEKAEILQLINTAPSSMPVLYNVVEECEQRFDTEQLELLLSLCQSLGREPLHR